MIEDSLDLTIEDIEQRIKSELGADNVLHVAIFRGVSGDSEIPFIEIDIGKDWVIGLDTNYHYRSISMNRMYNILHLPEERYAPPDERRQEEN